MDTTKKNTRPIFVGIFVLIAIIAFLVGIFVLGGKQKRFEKTIFVKAIFDNVSGLKVGNNVWFSGVKIGVVKTMHFYGTSQVEITMKIEDDSREYIHKDARARLGSESLIGSKLVEIYGGNPQMPAVEDGDKLLVDKSPDSNEIMATLEKNNRNLLTITGDIKVLTSQLVKGKGTLGILLSDSTMARQLGSTIDNLQRVSEHTTRVAEELSHFSAKLNTPHGLANEVLTDTVVFARLRYSVDRLRQVSISAARMTDTLQHATSKLNSNKSPVGVLLNDEKVASQLKNTMTSLESSSIKLDQNMEALQHNFLLRGFFKKKAKREAKELKEAKASQDQQTVTP